MHDKHKDQIISHALSEYPNESVGVIANGSYIRLRNESQSPDKDFYISPRQWIAVNQKFDVEALIHSHNNFPHASEADQKLQMLLNIDCGIINLKEGRYDLIFYWGNNIDTPILGRRFINGVHDCFSLVRDYYKQTLGITIPNAARPHQFWKIDRSIISDNLYLFKEFEQVSINNLERNDILLYQFTKTIDHVGLYLSDNIVLHHFINQKSAMFPLEHRKEYLKLAYRKK